MLDLDEQWWMGGMAADIYSRLKFEEDNMNKIDINPQFEELRKYCASWIVDNSKKIQMKRGAEFDLCPATVHLAVHLLDRFIAFRPQFSIALVVLHIAAKVEEADNRIPKLETLMAKVKPRANLKYVYLALEREALLYFDFQFLFPTVPQFTPYFISLAHSETYEVSYNGLQHSALFMYSNGNCVNCPQEHFIPPSREERKRCSLNMLEKYVEEHMEICLQDVCYRMNRPSLVAAACVAVARMRICWLRRDHWPLRIQNICQIYAQEIDHIVTRLAVDVTILHGEHAFQYPSMEVDWISKLPLPPLLRPAPTTYGGSASRSCDSRDSGVDCNDGPPVLPRQAPAGTSGHNHGYISLNPAVYQATSQMYYQSHFNNMYHIVSGHQQANQYNNQYVPILPHPPPPQEMQFVNIPKVNKTNPWSWTVLDSGTVRDTNKVPVRDSQCGTRNVETMTYPSMTGKNAYLEPYPNYSFMNQGVTKPFIVDVSPPAPPDPKPARKQPRRVGRPRKRQASSVTQFPVPSKRPVDLDELQFVQL